MSKPATVNYELNELEHVIADDRAWFRKHRDKRQRLRRSHACEDPSGATTMMLVTELAPGARTRQGLKVAEDLIGFMLEINPEHLHFDGEGAVFVVLNEEAQAKGKDARS